MKRGFLFVGLAVVVCVGVGWWAKRVSNRRPVMIGKFPPFNGESEFLSASPDKVLAVRVNRLDSHTFNDGGDLQTQVSLFDVGSQKARSFSFAPQRQFTGLSGDELWGLSCEKAKHVGHVGVEGGKQFSFQSSDFEAGLLGYGQATVFRVFPSQNRAVLLCLNRIYNWNLQTGQLENNTSLGDAREVDLRMALSRDGNDFVTCAMDDLNIGDARTGKITKSIRFQDPQFDSLSFSAYGKYALCEVATTPPRMRVVDAATGKSLWGFNTLHSDTTDWTVSDDEETVFVHRGNSWEVRDLKTGNVRGTLPWIAGTTTATSSPDGATLYSIVNNVLYRQSA